MRRCLGGGLLSLLAVAGLAAGLAGAGTARAQAPPDIRPFQTAHFNLENHSNMMNMEVKLLGEGDIVMPDSMRLSMGLMGQKFELIQVGGKSYQRSPLLGDPSQWYVEEAATKQAANDVDPLAMLSAIGGLKSLTPLPDEAVDGTPAEHFQAELDPAALNALGTRSASRPNQVGQSGMSVQNMQFTRAAMELWVAKDTRFVVQQRMQTEVTFQLAAAGAGAGAGAGTSGGLPGLPPPTAGPGAAAAPTGLTIAQDLLMHYRDFDQPITIAPPDGAVPMPAR